MKKILIVGTGPVGMTLALALKKHAIEFDIIEKNEIRNKNSKALTLTSSSINSLRKLAIQDQLIEAGKKISKINIYSSNFKVASIDKKKIDSEYNYYLAIPQYKTEQILESQLKAENIHITNAELVDITKDNDDYCVIIKSNSSQKTYKYDYIIGCDGASSKTRKILNIPFTGKEYKTTFLIADLSIKESFPITDTSYFSFNNYFIGIFPISKNSIRIVISNNNGFKSLNDESKTFKYIQNMLKDNLNISNKLIKIIWKTTVDIKQLYADSTKFPKNIFLMGDSWHIYSPVGGQTLNTGFQDAIDLGWRLAFYIKNKANKSILDDFLVHRSISHQKVKYITDIYTEFLIGNKVNKQKYQIFPMRLSNRELYKNLIPTTFAGYNFDHKVDNGILVGQYFNYLKNSKYSLITNNLSYCKFSLVTYKNIKLDLETNELINVIKITEAIMKDLTKHYYKKEYCLLISPSGFIYQYDLINEILNKILYRSKK